MNAQFRVKSEQSVEIYVTRGYSINAFTHARTHTHTHTHTHTYTHTNAHSHTQIHAHSARLSNTAELSIRVSAFGFIILSLHSSAFTKPPLLIYSVSSPHTHTHTHTHTLQPSHHITSIIHHMAYLWHGMPITWHTYDMAYLWHIIIKTCHTYDMLCKWHVIPTAHLKTPYLHNVTTHTTPKAYQIPRLWYTSPDIPTTYHAIPRNTSRHANTIRLEHGQNMFAVITVTTLTRHGRNMPAQTMPVSHTHTHTHTHTLTHRHTHTHTHTLTTRHTSRIPHSTRSS